MHQIRISVAIFVLLASTALGWESNDELYARAVGDGNMTLLTDLNKSVNFDGSEKSFLATLMATGVKEIRFDSSNFLTRVDENGELITTGNKIEESLSLPGEFDVFMLHNQSFSGSSIFPGIGTSSLRILDPDSPGEENLTREASSDADGLEVDNMMDGILRDTLGEGVTLERFEDMMQDITFSHQYESSKGGVACYSGESKNMAINMV